MEELYYSVGLVLFAVCGAILFVLSERRVHRSKLKQFASRVTPEELIKELGDLLVLLEDQHDSFTAEKQSFEQDRGKSSALNKSMRNAIIALKAENESLTSKISVLEARISNLEDQPFAYDDQQKRRKSVA